MERARTNNAPSAAAFRRLLRQTILRRQPGLANHSRPFEFRRPPMPPRG